jgi:hypothetical protein
MAFQLKIYVFVSIWPVGRVGPVYVKKRNASLKDGQLLCT